MNGFLKSRREIHAAGEWLSKNGYRTHPISCKDWELMHATQFVGDGDFLDMGADGSFVLHNVITKGVKGKKMGIDLMPVVGMNKAEGAEYFVGDLMHTPYDDASFDYITSLSTIEHEVNLGEFAQECSRLLRKNGQLLVSFDFWTPKPDTSHVTLYGLKWNILDATDVSNLILACHEFDMDVTEDIDWVMGDAVITDKYCSPAQGVSYTFGMIKFKKQ